METSYTLGIQGLVLLLGGYAWWTYQRSIAKNDASKAKEEAEEEKEQSDYRRDIHDSFARMQDKIDKLEDAAHHQEVAMAKTMNQQDVASIFSKIDSVQSEVKKDMETMAKRQDDLLGKVLVALTSK